MTRHQYRVTAGLLLGVALLLFTPLAHALDFESAPTDTHGRAFADDDTQFDDLQGGSGHQGMSFNGGTVSSYSGGQLVGAPTGAQLMDSGTIHTRRR